MQYENEQLGVAFELPDKMTVRQQLDFRGRIAMASNSPFVRYWQAAQGIMTNWQCELVPDMAELNLDEADDVRIADIVQWTANTVAGHMTELGMPPKK